MKKTLGIITLALALASSAGALGPAAGTTIVNTANFEYTDPSDNPVDVPVTTTVTVGENYGLIITPDGTVAAPGQTVYALPGRSGTLSYLVTNTSNTAASIALASDDGNGKALPSGSTIRRDANGNDTLDDTDPVVSSLDSLAADQSVRVFVTVPVGQIDQTTGGASSYGNLSGTVQSPTGTSTAPGAGAQDTNNVGRVTTASVMDFTLTGEGTHVLPTPGKVDVPLSLTNTGNTPINPAELVPSSTLTDPNKVVTTVIYNTTDPSGTSGPKDAPDLKTSLTGLAPLQPGQSYTITVTYTSDSGNPNNPFPNGQTATNLIQVYANPSTPDGAGFVNNVPSTNPRTHTDTLTTARGVANFTKTAYRCVGSTAQSTTCDNPQQVLPGQFVYPGELLLYVVRVINDGTLPLSAPKIREYVPKDTIFVSATGGNGPVNTGLQVMYSVDDKATWNSAPPTSLATATSATSGPFIYAAVDSNNNNAIDAADGLKPGEQLQLNLLVRVRNDQTQTP